MACGSVIPGLLRATARYGGADGIDLRQLLQAFEETWTRSKFRIQGAEDPREILALSSRPISAPPLPKRN